MKHQKQVLLQEQVAQERGEKRKEKEPVTLVFNL